MSQSMMKSTKYRRYTRSKYQFPTRVVVSGSKGALVIGRKPAAESLARELNRPIADIDRMKASDTRTLWVWRELREETVPPSTGL